MKACEEYIDLILRAVDGELSPLEQEGLDAHLSSCEGCKALYETYCCIRDGVASMDEAPKGDLVGAVMREIRAEKEKTSPLYLLKRGKFTLIALVAVLALVVVSRFGMPKMDASANTASATVQADESESKARMAEPEAQWMAGGAEMEDTEAAADEAAEAEVAEAAAEEAAPAYKATEAPQLASDGAAKASELEAIAEQLEAEGYESNLYRFPELSEEALAEMTNFEIVHLSDGTLLYEIPEASLETVMENSTCAETHAVEEAHEYAYLYLG